MATRLYKHQRWYAGLCYRLTSRESSCLLYLDPFLRFNLGHEASPALITEEPLFDARDTAVPDSRRDNERPFVLEQCIVSSASTSSLTLSFRDGVAILSKRTLDVTAIKEVFDLVPFNPFTTS